MVDSGLSLAPLLTFTSNHMTFLTADLSHLTRLTPAEWFLSLSWAILGLCSTPKQGFEWFKILLISVFLKDLWDFPWFSQLHRSSYRRFRPLSQVCWSDRGQWNLGWHRNSGSGIWRKITIWGTATIYIWYSLVGGLIFFTNMFGTGHSLIMLVGLTVSPVWLVRYRAPHGIQWFGDCFGSLQYKQTCCTGTFNFIPCIHMFQTDSIATFARRRISIAG